MINARIDIAGVRNAFHFCPRTGTLHRRHNGSFLKEPVGWLNSHGYLVARVGKKLHYVHRIVWAYCYGEQPPPMLDHRNGSKTDNRLSNLRPAELAQNLANAAVRKHKKSTPYKGVFPLQSGKFFAQFMHKGQTYRLSPFDTAEAAALARLRKAKEVCGEYASA